MRRAGAWFVVAPLALAGIAAAHTVANAAFGSPQGRGELFASPASGADLLPLLTALTIALVLLGVVLRVATPSSLPRDARALALPLVVLPPLGFVLLELLEGLLHAGTVPWSEALEPTFLVGVALQLPFALAAYLVARLLLRGGDRLRALLSREPWTPAAGWLGPVGPRRDDDLLFSCSSRWRERGRAPPPGLTVSG